MLEMTILDIEAVGIIPDFVREDDPRPAREQFNERYAHGGGWSSFNGFKLDKSAADPIDWSIKYPGDPIMYPVAKMKLRDEIILIYPYGWVCIVQPDGSFETARLD